MNRSERLDQTVAQLQSAVASGMVPNALFTAAKDTINREVDRLAEAFLATGPHTVRHHQSDWWLAAYQANAFVSGAHSVPSVIKRASKAGLREYVAFIRTELLPVYDVLQAAKPLIVKRGDMPKVRTERQIVDDAKRMTCQCCGRRIFAETGTIAHHGYQRPGEGWQTSSCYGAKELPFEVSRDRLGQMIKDLRTGLANQIESRKGVDAEIFPVVYYYTALLGVGDSVSMKPGTKYVSLTRGTFDKEVAKVPPNKKPHGSECTFDTFKRRDLAERDSKIESLRRYITELQVRYNGWKQTHRREGDAWVEV